MGKYLVGQLKKIQMGGKLVHEKMLHNISN